MPHDLDATQGFVAEIVSPPIDPSLSRGALGSSSLPNHFTGRKIASMLEGCRLLLNVTAI